MSADLLPIDKYEARRTDVVRTPQSAIFGCVGGAAGVSMNSNESSDVVDLAIDILTQFQQSQLRAVATLKRLVETAKKKRVCTYIKCCTTNDELYYLNVGDRVRNRVNELLGMGRPSRITVHYSLVAARGYNSTVQAHKYSYETLYSCSAHYGLFPDGRH